MSETVLDRLVHRVREALAFDPNVRVAPAALLWPDEARHWEAVIDRLSEHLPTVTLGDYDPDSRSGPSYWVRCVVAATIDAGLADGPPIVYLPGVARSAVRAAETCPSSLAPLAELQYRGQWFSNPNGRDWSVRALLMHPERGIGLRVADDGATADALLLALGQLLDEQVDRLDKLVLLDAQYFRDLVHPDPVRSLLGWLDDPHGYRSRLDDAQWTAFVQQSRADYRFDPDADGEMVGARMLAERQGKWANAWQVFATTPERYPGIPEQLRRARPQEQLTFGLVGGSEVWPQDNEMAEGQLRNQLRDFEALTAEGARKEAAILDAEHEWRRRTVWAELDLAPLAFALEQLVLLAELSTQPLADADLTALVNDYADRGWRVDDAALRALSLVTSGDDRAAVGAAVSAMYRSWLDAGARALQAAVGPMANAHTYTPGEPAASAPGTVTVFVDGLRLDLAHRLKERLASGGLETKLTTALAALPTVTETAKPVLVPVPDGALAPGDDLGAARTSSGAKATKSVLESLAAEVGVQSLDATELGDPAGVAWTEAGRVDHLGHEAGVPLIDEVDREIDKIARRVRQLLEAGWPRVDVVTDHGWVLLPGGLEKVELPIAATAMKKGRCARLKEGAAVETPTVPWYWDQDVCIALAPGLTCFEANKEYEHGGVSPQECFVPRATVTAGTVSPTAEAPDITGIKWLGLLCRVELSGTATGLTADIRALPADPSTSIAETAKETAGAARVSLVVPDEQVEGERAYVVLVADDGRILAQRDVTVGSNR